MFHFHYIILCQALECKKTCTRVLASTSRKEYTGVMANKERWTVPKQWTILLVKGENGHELHILYGSTHIPLSDDTGEKLEQEVKEYWRKMERKDYGKMIE